MLSAEQPCIRYTTSRRSAAICHRKPQKTVMQTRLCKFPLPRRKVKHGQITTSPEYRCKVDHLHKSKRAHHSHSCTSPLAASSKQGEVQVVYDVSHPPQSCPKVPVPRALRSQNLLLASIKRAKKKSFGDRALSIARPHLWNELPIATRSAPPFSHSGRDLRLTCFLISNY